MIPPKVQATTLLSAAALVCVPSMVLSFLAQVLLAGPNTAIVNGVLFLPRLESWWLFGFVAVAWLWAVGAGILVLAEGLSATAAVRQALRRLPGIVVTAGCWFVLLIAIQFIVSALDLPSLAAFVAMLVLGGRALLLIPVLVRGRRAYWTIASGNGWRVTFWAAAGVIAPGLALQLIWEELATSWLPPNAAVSALAVTIQVLLALLVVMLQAVTLTRLHQGLQPDTNPSEKGYQSGRPLATQAAIGASLLLPALVLAGVASANRHEFPDVRASEHTFSGIRAVGWPAGQHPIIVHSGGFADCLDELCGDFADRTGIQIGSEHGAASVSQQGNVVALSTSAQVVTITRCTRSGSCAAGKLTGLPGRPEWTAIAEALDGSILVATAHRPDRDVTNYELAVIWCADIACAAPKRTVVGTLPQLDGKSPDPVHIGRASDGSLYADFSYGFYSERAACGTPDCHSPQLSQHINTASGLLHGHELTTPQIGGRAFAVIMEHQRYALVACGDDDCSLRRTVTLRLRSAPMPMSEPLEQARIAARADGRVLVVLGQHVYTASAI